MKKDRSVIPEAMSAEEAADTAVLPSVLQGAADKQLDPAAVWQPCCASASILLPASTLVKQKKKALAKLFSSFAASTAPFYCAQKMFNIFLLILLLEWTSHFSISGRFQTLLGTNKSKITNTFGFLTVVCIHENKFLKCSLPTIGSNSGCLNVWG